MTGFWNSSDIYFYEAVGLMFIYLNLYECHNCKVATNIQIMSK